VLIGFSEKKRVNIKFSTYRTFEFSQGVNTLPDGLRGRLAGPVSVQYFLMSVSFGVCYPAGVIVRKQSAI